VKYSRGVNLRRKIVTSVFIVSVAISVIFLVYAGDLYFRTSCLTNGVSVSIQASDIEQRESGMVLRSVFLLENPSSLSFKVTYVREEVYDGPSLETRLGDTYISAASGSYIAFVNESSDVTIDVTVPLTKAPSSEDLMVKVYMRFADIPIIDSMYLTRYLSLPLNASGEGGIR